MGTGEFFRENWDAAPVSGLAGRTDAQDIHQTFSLPSLCRALFERQGATQMNMP